MKLTKSLEELDAVADELLAKSKAAEDDKSDEVSPEDIADDTASTPESDTDEVDDEEDHEDVEKCNVKKSEEPEDIDEDEEPEDDDEDDEPEDEPEDIEKSYRDEFDDNTIIRNGVDGNEFFAAMVDVFSKSLGDMQYDVQHQTRQQNAASDIIAKSMQAVVQANAALKSENEKLTRRINKLEKSISQGFDRVMDSLDEISSQPVGMRKSMSSINVQERDFTQSVNGHSTMGGFESLNKSQVLTALNNELYSGNPNVTAQDIIGYESGAPLRSDLQSLVVSKYSK